MDKKIKHALQMKTEEYTFPSKVNIEEIIGNKKKYIFRNEKKIFVSISSVLAIILFSIIFLPNGNNEITNKIATTNETVNIVIKESTNKVTNETTNKPSKVNDKLTIMATPSNAEQIEYVVYNDKKFIKTKNHVNKNDIGEKISVIENQTNKETMGIKSVFMINDTNLPVGTEIYLLNNSLNITVNINGEWFLFEVEKQ